MGPSWLTDGEGGLVAYTLDLLKDAAIKRLVLGLRARFPQDPIDPTGQTTAPADALVALGRDRRVFRGIFETDAQYAARLVTWLDERKTAGNPFTLMRQLHAYTGTTHGVSFRTVDVNGNWYSRAADGTETSSVKQANWNWDGDTARWSRFWVIVYPGTLWAAEGLWGSAGTWGDTPSGTIGATVTPEQATSLRSIVADWKPAGTRGDVILAFDAASFNPASPEPDGHWGKWYFGADAPQSRLSTARYSGA